MSAKTGNAADGLTLELEVVRGREIGRRFPLPAGVAVLGSRLEPGRPGIDLSGQQQSESPRQVAPAHAQCERTAAGVMLRDLGTPGGTFVNRARISRNEPRLLAAGDVIQLGGVQLRVVEAAAPAPTSPPVQAATRTVTTRPTPSSRPAQPTAGGPSYPLSGGVTCRSWDDFVRLSTQRWSELRDELTSGRLAASLEKAGLGAFAPNPLARGTPDERLDAWLQRIPSGLAARPELDVHPTRIEVALAGGPDGEARTTRTVRISNTGYGLLRVRPRLDPPDAVWIQIAGLGPTGELHVVDSAELKLAVSRPAGSDPKKPLHARLLLESGGATRPIDIVLGSPQPAAHDVPDASGGSPEISQLRDGLTATPIARRLSVGAAIGLSAGLAVWLGGRLGPASLTGSIGWTGPAAVFLAAGAGLGAWRMGRAGRPFDRLAGAVAGASGGLAAAGFAVATSRVLGAALGVRPDIAAIGLGPLLGLLVAAFTAILIPHQPAGAKP